MSLTSKRERKRIVSALLLTTLIAIVFLSYVPVIYILPASPIPGNSPFFSSAAGSTQGIVVLGTDYSFYSTTYNTYVLWSQTVYANSVSYFPDHLNFTEAALGSTSNPAWSFGVGTSGDNLTITQINSGSIELDDTPAPASTVDVYFYYSGGIPLSVSAGGTLISQGSFLQTYSKFTSCTAPCVFLNQTGSYLEISNPAGTVTKNLVYPNSQTTTTSTSVSSTSSTTTTSSSTKSSSTTTSSTTTSKTTTTTQTTTTSSSSPSSTSTTTTSSQPPPSSTTTTSTTTTSNPPPTSSTATTTTSTSSSSTSSQVTTSFETTTSQSTTSQTRSTTSSQSSTVTTSLQPTTSTTLSVSSSNVSTSVSNQSSTTTTSLTSSTSNSTISSQTPITNTSTSTSLTASNSSTSTALTRGSNFGSVLGSMPLISSSPTPLGIVIFVIILVLVTAAPFIVRKAMKRESERSREGARSWRW